MSHFTVLVVGDDPESKLEPYSERLEVPEYIREAVSEEEKKRFMDFYVNKKQTVSADASFEEVYAKHGEDWNSGVWRKDANGVWQEYSTYNPKSKWDWYELGGRWTGFFKLKPMAMGTQGEPGLMTKRAKPGYADQARKKDIDFETMRTEARQKAKETYDKYLLVLNGRELPPRWKEIREKHGDNIDAAREEYRSHPVVRDMRKADLEPWDEDLVDTFGIGCGRYLQRAEDAAGRAFAFIKDGKWYERGEMGWWGCVANEKCEQDWDSVFRTFIDELPDDTLLSVYDCHI